MKDWIITNRKYKEKDFFTEEESNDFEIKLLKAKDVEVGDWIITQNYSKFTFSIFIVDHIEIEFTDIVTDEMVEEAEKNQEIYPDEWSKYEFTFEDNGGSKGLAIQEIPHTAKFLVIRNKKNDLPRI
jgi:hypothetical protein